VSHFTLSSLNLASAQVRGLFPLGTLGGGFVGGYMAAIPPEWQAALGAPDLTGQAAIPIISRTSSGPAAFGFEPSNLGSAIAPDIPYVYYPINHQLGWNSDPLFNGTTTINGAAFAPGTRSVLFIGANGVGPIGYGEAQDYNDIYRPYKGYHSQDGVYQYEVWAYDVVDLLAVKNGLKQPWEIRPYQTWSFDVPVFDGGKTVGGTAFDPATGRLFISQMGTGVGRTPLIQVFQLSVT
jgi:hypothetical protein